MSEALVDAEKYSYLVDGKAVGEKAVLTVIHSSSSNALHRGLWDKALQKWKSWEWDRRKELWAPVP